MKYLFPCLDEFRETIKRVAGEIQLDKLDLKDAKEEKDVDAIRRISARLKSEKQYLFQLKKAVNALFKY